MSMAMSVKSAVNFRNTGGTVLTTLSVNGTLCIKIGITGESEL